MVITIKLEMKKILACFFAAVVLSACGNKGSEVQDKTDLTSKFDATVNIHERVEKNSDGTITYHSVEWGGLLGSVRDHNMPVDWSKYESVTVYFAEPTIVETQLLVASSYKAYGRKGITTLTCNFDGQDVRSIDEVILQTAEAGTLKISEVRLNPISEHFTSQELRTLDCEFDDWKNGFVLPPEMFAKANEGDRLEIRYTTARNNPDIANWLIKAVYNGTDKTLEGNEEALNQWGCAPVGARSTLYRIPLTAGDVKMLKEKGVFINGRYLHVTQCNLLHEDNDQM